MPVGISVHIGVNRLERTRYPGRTLLRGCENDARAMERIARAQGFRTTLLLGRKATVEAVKAAVAAAAEPVGSDGILLVTFAGHGGFVPDAWCEEDRLVAEVEDRRDFIDGNDETWCLWDRQMLDDEIFRMWTAFAPGARVLLVSDSCHAGGIIRADRRRKREPPPPGVRTRALNARQAEAAFHAQADVYAGIQRALHAHPAGEPCASVFLLAAAQELEEAEDGDPHGKFSDALLRVWKDGSFRGGHREFHAAIYRTIQARHTPVFLTLGPANPAFERQRPFTI